MRVYKICTSKIFTLFRHPRIVCVLFLFACIEWTAHKHKCIVLVVACLPHKTIHHRTKVCLRLIKFCILFWLCFSWHVFKWTLEYFAQHKKLALELFLCKLVYIYVVKTTPFSWFVVNICKYLACSSLHYNIDK